MDDNKRENDMPTYEAFYAFLKKHYRHERFEGRNGKVWGEDYSHVVARSSYEMLKATGSGVISRHESNSGEPVSYDQSLSSTRSAA